MPDLDLSQGIDLSALSKPSQSDIPEGAVRCEVDGGCNFLVQSANAHVTVSDCLATSMPYVEMYMQVEEAAVQVAQEYQKLEAYAVQLKRQNQSLLEANRRLLTDVEQYAADLRRLRKDNPEEQKNALLAAAGDLVKAVQPDKPAADPVADAAKKSAANFLSLGNG